MKILLNIFKFLIYVPLCIGLLMLMHWCILIALFWIVNLSMFWMIIAYIFAYAITGIFIFLFSFLNGILSYLNPYKKLFQWIIIPVAAIAAFHNIYMLWTESDLSYTKIIFVVLFGSGLFIYCTMGFLATAISKNPKELLE